MADIDTTNADTLLEMGPIDYIVLEWPGQQPDGSVAPLILELVDRGLIRILDVAFMAKDENGSAWRSTSRDIDAAEAFGAFEGASSGLLRQEDLEEAAAALEPGTPRPCSCGRTAGPPRSPSRCASPAASSSPAAASPSRPSSRRSTRSRAPTDREEPPCPDCFAGSPAPPSSPVPPRPSATASRAGRRRAGPQQEPQHYGQQPQQRYDEPPPPPPPAAAAGPDRAAQGARGAAGTQGILTDEEFAGGEGQDPRH